MASRGTEAFGDVGSWPVLVICLLAAFFVGAASGFGGGSLKPTSRVEGLEFISWRDIDKLPEAEQSRVLVTDCTRPGARWCLTHHRQSRPLPEGLRGDASTDIMLNALLARHESVLPPTKQVSCNHYDVDGFCAVFAALRPAAALRHEALLR